MRPVWTGGGEGGGYTKTGQSYSLIDHESLCSPSCSLIKTQYYSQQSLRECSRRQMDYTHSLCPNSCLLIPLISLAQGYLKYTLTAEIMSPKQIFCISPSLVTHINELAYWWVATFSTVRETEMWNHAGVHSKNLKKINWLPELYCPLIHRKLNFPKNHIPNQSSICNHLLQIHPSCTIQWHRTTLVLWPESVFFLSASL